MLASWAFSGNRCRGFPHLCWPALIGLLSVYHAAHAGLRAHAAATGEQPALTVTACNIEATFHVREKTLAAQAAIVLKASGPVTAVPLELNPLLTLEAAELDGHPLQVIRSRTPASARLLVVLPQPRTGSFSLTFRYHGSLRLPANSADYWTDGGLLLTDDSRWYPLFDARAFTQNRLELRVPAGFIAFASGTPLGRLAADATTIVWQTETPVPSRAVAIVAATPTGCSRDPAADLELCFAVPQEDLFPETRQRLFDLFARYRHWFGRPVLSRLWVVEGFPHLHGVAGFSGPGMLVVSTDALRFAFDPLYHPEFFPHELAHQWFPGGVEMQTNADGWLAESLAEYLALRVLEQTQPQAAQWMLRRASRDALSLDPLPPLRLGLDLLGASDWNTAYRTLYQRGMLVWRTLETLLGQQVLDRALAVFYTTFYGRKASLQDFLSIAREVSGEPLDAFSRYFLDGSRVPSFHLRLRWKHGRRLAEGTVEVAQCPPDLAFPLELAAFPGNVRQTVTVRGCHAPFHLASAEPIRGIEVDPEYRILHWTPAAELNRRQRQLLIQADWMERFGELEEAIALCRQALAVDPQDRAANRQALEFRLARLLWQKKQFAPARKALAASLEARSLDPATTQFYRTWAYLLLARLELEGGHPAEAQKALVQAATALPAILQEPAGWRLDSANTAQAVLTRLKAALNSLPATAPHR